MKIEDIKKRIEDLVKLAYIQGGIDTIRDLKQEARDDHNQGEADQIRNEEK